MVLLSQLAMIVPIGGCLITCGLYLVVFAQAGEAAADAAAAEGDSDEDADDENGYKKPLVSARD